MKKMTKNEISTFAINLKDKVDAAFNHEIASSEGKNQLSYAGVRDITSMIENDFLATCEEIPDIIKGACFLARGLRNPDKMKTQEDLRKGLGLLVVTAGGIGICMGILTMTAAVGIWSTICIFIAGAHTPILGPIAVAGGLAALVAGVYTAVSTATPQALSAKAHDLLIEVTGFTFLFQSMS